MNSPLSISLKCREQDFELDVAFEIGPGITTVFGPSGAGKTMILDCIAGLKKPNQGQIVSAGRPLVDTQTNTYIAPEKREIGYVFQHGRLFPHLTVERNLRYGEGRGSPNEARISFDQVVAVLGIENLLARRTHKLSGGEQQRVAIGRALLSNPKLLLMDEPLASLDPSRRLEILPFIERLRSEFGIPIIYVSHNLDEVIRLSDLTLLIDGGKVIARGPIDEIMNRSDLQSFLGLSDQSGDYLAPSTILDARVSEHDLPFGLTRAYGQGLSLWIPKLNQKIGEPVRIRLKSSDVAITRSEPENTSVLNTFMASVDGIDEPTGGFIHVHLRLESGLKITSRITHRSATRLRLQVADTVWGSVKSVAVITGAASQAQLERSP
jgi:molybdate transport system ATP-binding protein